MSNKAQRDAEKYFVEHGLMPAKEDRTEVWVLHHKDETLRHTDLKRYYEWRVEDLVPMTAKDHLNLHNRGIPFSEERKAKMSAAHSNGKEAGENNGMWGKKHSDKTRAQMSQVHKKPVICIETGTWFDSLSAASEAMHIGQRSISTSCNTGRSFFNYHFEWAK